MVWRRLLLRSDQSIADLHYAIQIVMNWSDQHLHRFRIHGKDYGVTHIGGVGFSDDADHVLLSRFQFRLRERFLYEYDFYDRWVHEIRLEKTLPLSSQRLYPVCVGGQHQAPPEDCGGARAYGEGVDPRWREWWKNWPRNEFQTAIKVVQRFLDHPGESIRRGDADKLLAAVTAWNKHRRRAPDKIDRRAINQRLQRYATGDRKWLFCETIGG
jgi:hypothetical protein